MRPVQKKAGCLGIMVEKGMKGMRKKEKPRERDIWEEFIIAGYDPDVLREYDLEPERARPVRGVMRIKTRDGYRMLKRVSVSEARLKFVFSALEFLYPKFPRVPRFIRTKYADPYVVTPRGLYYLTMWLPGREADLKQAKQMFLATQMLAWLHQAASGYEAHGFIDSGKDDFLSLLLSYRDNLERYAKDAVEHGESPWARQLLQIKGALTEKMDWALEQLRESPYVSLLEQARKEKMLCHGSYSKQNVLVDGSNAYVVDFDHCHYGTPVQDLGSFLHRYMPRYGWDCEMGLSVLQVYQEVRPFSQDERHVLAAYLSYPLKLAQIISWYYTGVRGWTEEKYAHQLSRVLEMETAREEFVRALTAAYRLPLTFFVGQAGSHHEGEGEIAGEWVDEGRDGAYGEVVHSRVVKDEDSGEDRPTPPEREKTAEQREDTPVGEGTIQPAVFTRTRRMKKNILPVTRKAKAVSRIGLWLDERQRIRSTPE